MLGQGIRVEGTERGLVVVSSAGAAMIGTYCLSFVGVMIGT